MPEISRFFGIIIRMYANDHNPPHFQAYYGEYESSFSLEPITMVKGYLPPRVQGLVVEWASMHIDDLKTNWEVLQSREGHFKKIKPLG